MAEADGDPLRPARPYATLPVQIGNGPRVWANRYDGRPVGTVASIDNRDSVPSELGGIERSDERLFYRP